MSQRSKWKYIFTTFEYMDHGVIEDVKRLFYILSIMMQCYLHLKGQHCFFTYIIKTVFWGELEHKGEVKIKRRCSLFIITTLKMFWKNMKPLTAPSSVEISVWIGSNAGSIWVNRASLSPHAVLQQTY